LFEREDHLSDEADSDSEIKAHNRLTAVQSLSESLQCVCELPARLTRIGEAKDTARNVAKTDSGAQRKIFRIPSYERL
jgi:hypothetical protein